MKLFALLALSLSVSNMVLAGDLANESGMTASQIVEKNVAARGGLEAWRKIQSMVWVGHVVSTNASVPGTPFVLEMKRPNKTRFEVNVQGQTAVHMYDGVQGWKLNPTHHGKPVMHPYTPDELGYARDVQIIDGPLVDYQAKGVAVSLDGVDEVEGHKAYRLILKLPSGNIQHVWIDAKEFLDIKYDRLKRNTDGTLNTVSVLYRDYKTIEGVQIPLIIESGVDTSKTMEKLVIDRVLLNPPMDDRKFANHSVQGWHSTATVDIYSPRPAGPFRHDGFPSSMSQSVSGAGVSQ